MMPDPNVRRRYADLFDADADEALLDAITHLDRLYDAVQPPVALSRTALAGSESSNKGRIPMDSQQTSGRESHRPRIWHRTLAGLGGIAAVLAITLLAYSIFHIGSQSGTPYFGPGSQTALFDIDMVSPAEGWAVGGQLWRDEYDTHPGTGVIYHDVNGVWTQQYVALRDPAFPDGTYPVINGISMFNAHDGWAVGAMTKGSNIAFFLHYDGHQWRRVTPPLTAAERAYTSSPGYPARPVGFDNGRGSIQMLAPDEFWAATGTSLPDGSETYIHYHNGIWDRPVLNIPACRANLPGPSRPDQFTCNLQALAMLSSSEGWAVGHVGIATTVNGQQISDTNAGAIFHYGDGKWQLQYTLPHAGFSGVTMLSSTEGWAVGTQDDSSNSNSSESPVLLHYHDGVWQPASSPLSTLPKHASYFGSFSAPIAVQGQDLWLTVASLDSASRMATGPNVMVLRYAGGQWQSTNVPAQIDGRIAYVLNAVTTTSAGDTWAVGYVYDPPNGSLTYFPTLTSTAASTAVVTKTVTITPTIGPCQAKVCSAPAAGTPPATSTPGGTFTVGFSTTARVLILHYYDGTWDVVKD